MTLRSLWPLLLLVACSPDAPPKPVAPKTTIKPADPDALPVYRVALAETGLLLTDPRDGSAKPADFGLRQSLLIAILTRSFGYPEEGRDAGCGRDFARWPHRLTLWFDGGDFVGWSRDAGSDATAVTVAPGLPPDRLKAGKTCG